MHTQQQSFQKTPTLLQPALAGGGRCGEFISFWFMLSANTLLFISRHIWLGAADLSSPGMHLQTSLSPVQALTVLLAYCKATRRSRTDHDSKVMGGPAARLRYPGPVSI